jgi:hypothetical protein
MGFYKESDGSVEMTSRVYSDQTGFYLHIPCHIRNLLEVAVGNRIEARLDRIETSGGESRSMQADALLEVKGYWHEMYLPDNMAPRFGILSGDTVHLTLHRIARYGQVVDV